MKDNTKYTYTTTLRVIRRFGGRGGPTWTLFDSLGFTLAPKGKMESMSARKGKMRNGGPQYSVPISLDNATKRTNKRNETISRLGDLGGLTLPTTEMENLKYERKYIGNMIYTYKEICYLWA